MTQNERREYLINYLLKEDKKIFRQRIPDQREEQEKLLRSLMNVRLPKPVSEEFLKIQDDYLKERNLERGITDIEDLKPVSSDKRLYIWQGDITRLQVGAIVNAANSQMLGCFVPCHRCIDNAIHSAAGVELRAECSRQMNQKRIRYGRSYEEPTGQAMVTGGYNLPAEHVIHTVGPIVYYEVTDKLRQDLKNCYESVLNCCLENNIRSVAFCCISTGVFRFPQEKAAEIAVETVKRFLEQDDTVEQVIFNVFTDRDLELYRRQLKK